MLVICPACKGARHLYYMVDLPPVVISDKPDACFDMAVEKTLEDCRTCHGAGQVEASERIRVMQDGRQIGTVPPNFDPDRIVSRNIMYQPRRGDFRRVGDTWVANPMLGNGDLEAVPGFAWI